MAPKDLFICHNGADKDWAKELGARVEAEQWNGRNLTVFLDEWDIDIGANILLKLDEALASCRFLAVLMSPEMIGSEWCKLEYTAILADDPTNRRGRLIPIRLRDFHRTNGERLDVPPILRGLNHLDFRKKDEFERVFPRLLAKLRGEPPPRGRPKRERVAPEALTPALPEGREEPDPHPEGLLSNLLPLTSIPKSVWSAPTHLRLKSDLRDRPHLPPFILREERLYAFTDLLGKDGAFEPEIDTSDVRQHSVIAWQNDPVRWRWFVELLNLALRDHLWPEVQFDREHRRYWFVPQADTSVKLKWGAGTKRTVVRAPNKGTSGSWIHHAAELRFETIGSSVFLSVNPTYVFTTDGRTPVPRDAIRPLAAQWGGRERNGTILRHVLMWADVVTKGKKVCQILAGDQHIEITRLPATVETPVGLAGDRVRVKALLRYSNREWDLNVPFGFVIDDSPSAPFDEADDEVDDEP
ncbi:MAG: toll/interleukin-1 receptor domain-containing protein [Myxococcales bacterium]|nr:toll/interleukin-1 receptor domain-containing protein [Myxococcales bacterium]